MGVITADLAVVKSAAVQFLRDKLDDGRMSQTELAKLAKLERSHISEMLAGRPVVRAIGHRRSSSSTSVCPSVTP